MADQQFGDVYRIQDAIADNSGNLLASITKASSFNVTSPSQSNIYLYNAATPGWESKWQSPFVSASLFSDPEGRIFTAPAFNFFTIPTSKNIYGLQWNAGQLEGAVTATADEASWFGYGAASDGTYFFLSDYSNGAVVRTDHPTFGTGKPAPTLTADATDNDTAHAVELTFADDADWRAAITGVKASRAGGAATAVDYTAEAGKLKINGLSKAGDYQLTVNATGYVPATVSQTIALVPSVWYDLDPEGALYPITSIYVDDEQTVYALAGSMEKRIYYRGLQDASWNSVLLPSATFMIPIGFQVRFGKWYVTSYGLAGLQVYVSDNEGQSWNALPAPPTDNTSMALYPAAVAKDGTVYLYTNKLVRKLNGSASTWSQIDSIPDTNTTIYSISGLATSEDGSLYAAIKQYPKNGPFIGESSLYKYNGSGWTKIVAGPSPNLGLYADSDWNIHVWHNLSVIAPLPESYLYEFDGTEVVRAATLDTYEDAIAGIAYQGGLLLFAGQDRKSTSHNESELSQRQRRPAAAGGYGRQRRQTRTDADIRG
ncbi:hemoblobin-interacting domain-containing protein [Cohnella rhizosphaerae]|uniref:DUF1533 domain-containing protein n=1 Tax=Cohnella rhizosphaerae TaxID=1457232 RepID=A0A9X4L0T5_9BACL|nr:hemoblobin-interacting domain-containing protein [Cohnella rhizosphaerae]MDG0814460.1 DUF1533 domain-containing protein [Cohnella rhizosphaerae]